jgi:hypothetical protein
VADESEALVLGEVLDVERGKWQIRATQQAVIQESLTGEDARGFGRGPGSRLIPESASSARMIFRLAV